MGAAEPFAEVNWASKIDLATGRPVEIAEARYEDGQAFGDVVRGGGLRELGMPSFSNLSDNQLNELRHYIREQAELALGEE